VTTRASSADLLAGLSVAGLLLPEAVAYSGVANLPQPLCHGHHDLLVRRRAGFRHAHARRQRSRWARGARDRAPALRRASCYPLHITADAVPAVQVLPGKLW